MPRGRKNKYFTHVKPRLETIRAWRRRGLTEAEMCKNLGVGYSTFSVYKNDYIELQEVLKSGKEDAAAQVFNALFQRAVGFEYEEVQTVGTRSTRTGDEVVTRIRKIKKHVLPDVTAQIFYLKNRCSKDWNDRRQHEHSGPDGQALSPPVIHAYIPDNGRRVVRTGNAVNRIAGIDPDHT